MKKKKMNGIDKLKSFFVTGWGQSNKNFKNSYRERPGKYGRGMGRGRANATHLNSPSLAYKAIHGNPPKKYIPGKTSHPQKTWNGIPVDKELKTKWIKKLNENKNIEMRGSCAGHGPDRNSYIVFRLKPRQDKKAKDVAKKLNKIKGIYSISDVGHEGRPRIVAASKTYHGKKGWSKWWDKLPERVNKAVKSTVKKK